jgi:predicted flap endonuclease-1-like 5' DNA nuclease
MSAKSLLQIIKSIVGLSGTSSPESEAEPSAREDGTDVTVERTPDSAGEETTPSPEQEADETAEEATEETTGDEVTEDTEAEVEEAGGESVEVVKGIGPTFHDRLVEHGIETVADLADSDAAEVADAAQTSEGRAADWVERARNR